MPCPTLIRPPPIDPSKSPIENVLDLIALTDIGPDIFTNRRELWHPPGARGIYGGAVIAQSLSAAQDTIPAGYLIHSMHCYFVLAGDASIPVIYHVERVRDGKSFITRTVQARQRGKAIFTTTCSFMREGSGGEQTIEHEWSLPQEARRTMSELEGVGREAREGKVSAEERVAAEENGVQVQGPFASWRLGIPNSDTPHPELKRPQSWIRARGRISPSAGPQAHLSALAYMSDSYFIGTVSRVHGLWRFGSPYASPPPSRPIRLPTKSSSSSPPRTDPFSTTSQTLSPEPTHVQPETKSVSNPIVARLAAAEASENLSNTAKAGEGKRSFGMMVSLDHTIYFHRPREVVADEWMFTEMQSPWSGEGRGLVMQRIWSKSGMLLASCVQEGLCRLVQDEKARGSKL